MVRALLADTKTQTRRVVKPQPNFEHARTALGGDTTDARPVYDTVIGGVGLKHGAGTGYLNPNVFCPYGQPGDRLYVRETHCYVGPGSGSDLPSYIEEARDPRNHKPENCWYRADGERNVIWTPGIHMFRGLSRILLEITEIRVQRLQEISEEDAVAEGLDKFSSEFKSYTAEIVAGRMVSSEEVRTYVPAYQKLWDSINGADSWDLNPWVWAVSFRRVQP